MLFLLMSDCISERYACFSAQAWESKARRQIHSMQIHHGTGLGRAEALAYAIMGMLLMVPRNVLR